MLYTITELWRPARLVDIGPEDGTNWKLSIRGNGMEGSASVPYITLSYRWGEMPGFQLKKSNVHECVRGFPIASLPQTFQDAILVARELSIQFLWIDALCIIQDCQLDWEREVPTMRYVYANSACNISASDSPTQFSGLFRTRDPIEVLPAVYRPPNSKIPRWVIYDKHYWERHAYRGPLHTRGWVVQECLLSPRILYVGAKQILWECLTEASCEGFPRGIPRYVSHKSLDPLWSHLENRNENERIRSETTREMPVEIHALWQKLVQRYSSCQLSRMSDKLPAFAGIAKLFAEITGDEYIGGLWKSRLLDQLHWTVCEPRTNTSLVKRAPSWSWVAVDGAVRLHGLPSKVINLVKVLRVDLKQSSENPTIQIFDGILELSCLLQRSRRMFENKSSWHQIDGRRFEGSIYPDHADSAEDDQRTDFVILPLRTWTFVNYAPINVAGFILEAADDQELGAFRRVGYFTTDAVNDIALLGLTMSSSGLVSMNSSYGLVKVAIT
ncbi:MAG: hypothetical protein LQ351_008145 [Letrouitia transgressa]|nr:MAG: hypothetical protein LQ351_008145 [Letrouitia transgressa]